MLAVTSVTFFLVADVKCGLYEIKTTQQMLHMHQKMFRDRTEAMLDRRCPGLGPGPVLTLSVVNLWISVTLVVNLMH